MAKTNFYLDCRKSTDGTGHVVITVYHKGARIFLHTGIRLLPCEWDGKKVTDGKNVKSTNAYLEVRKNSIDNMLNLLALNGELNGLSPAELKGKCLEALGEKGAESDKNLFVPSFVRFCNMKRREGTRKLYAYALKSMREFDRRVDKMSFDDFSKEWIMKFYNCLLGGKSATSANIVMRCVKAVFNNAIDEEITTNYPLRKVRIRNVVTKDRSMSAEQLRELFSYPCAKWQKEYVDMFKLIFCLCGINIGDLANLKEVHNGRIEYDRLKTGKHYSIKVEPEAMEIIERYRGETHLLSILDRYRDYKDYISHINRGLKKVGMNYESYNKVAGTPLFPTISTYYARYSWATIAAELEIPYDTIAAALGHSRPGVTQVYIRTDMRKKVDEANRKVLDYVFG